MAQEDRLLIPTGSNFSENLTMQSTKIEDSGTGSPGRIGGGFLRIHHAHHVHGGHMLARSTGRNSMGRLMTAGIPQGSEETWTFGDKGLFRPRPRGATSPSSPPKAAAVLGFPEFASREMAGDPVYENNPDPLHDSQMELIDGPSNSGQTTQATLSAGQFISDHGIRNSTLNSVAADDFSMQAMWVQKSLVVLLVAFGTVCLLTNALVLGILSRQRRRGQLLMFRYQIIAGQCAAGLLASTAILMPLQALSQALLSHQQQHGNSSSLCGVAVADDPALQGGVIKATAAPSIMVAWWWFASVFNEFVLSSVLLLLPYQGLLLHLEASLRAIDAANHACVLSSQRVTSALMWLFWALTLGLSLVAAVAGHALLDPAQQDADPENAGCHRVGLCWSSLHWVAVVILTSASVVAFLVLWAWSRSCGRGVRKNCSRSGHPHGSTCPSRTDEDCDPILEGGRVRKVSTLIVSSAVNQTVEVSAAKSARTSFVAIMAALLPCLVLTKPDLCRIKLVWTGILLPLAGALTPITSLLCDEWISGFELEGFGGDRQAGNPAGTRKPDVHANDGPEAGPSRRRRHRHRHDPSSPGHKKGPGVVKKGCKVRVNLKPEELGLRNSNLKTANGLKSGCRFTGSEPVSV